MSVQLKTLAMKARLANKIRKHFYKAQLEKFTTEQKVEFFNEIFEQNSLMHWELINYKQKRRDKKDIHQARLDRGYKFKKKTSLKQYEEMTK